MAEELIRITGKGDAGAVITDTLVLTHDRRDKGRQRVQLESGREAGLFLDRGMVLHDGDVLVSDTGLCIRVRAAEETLSCVDCSDPHLLARIAYHLGNRHTPVAIGERCITYPHDHVLDDMVRGLGGTVAVIHGPFEPEDGAYHGGGHAH